ncbi:MAG: glycosyl hydrolase family 28-related protein [Puniceicoccales bacterium]
MLFCSIAVTGLAGISQGQEDIPVLNQVPGSDWLNVKDHGVVGDGEADDTAALQLILTGLKDGETLYFPPGIYRITDELLIHKDPATAGPELRYLGNAFYGHGSESILQYDGDPGKSMLRIRGMLHYRMIGLVFDGGGLAARGMFHNNRVEGRQNFQTHLYHEYVTVRNFTEHGIYFGPLKDLEGGASAETVFKHMIFENCGTGIAFLNFNDYNFTFEGCTFRDNGRYGVECKNGNFYVRNCRFEGNLLDIWANSEHSSSVRRSVSVGSGAFIFNRSQVSPLTVENNLVVDWRNPTAINSSGAPMLLFDNRFESSRGKRSAIRIEGDQPIVAAGNSLEGVDRLLNRESSNLINVEIAESSPIQIHQDETFMPTEVSLPTRLFDAKADFGAVGDGRADDSEALQKTIDAAREYGRGAIAYLPKGTYRTTRTLHVQGNDYTVGGSGLFSIIEFDGDPDADAVLVEASGKLNLESLRIFRKQVNYYKVSKEDRFRGREVTVSDFDGEGADIRQVSTGIDSLVTYHTVYTAGKYKEIPFILGFRLEGLGARDTVLLENIEGNIHVHDSGEATILQTSGYEGTVWLKGERRGGFIGILTRLTTHSEHALYIEDSHPLVASDFYIEQSPPESTIFKGTPADPLGRVTLGLVKMDNQMLLDGYHGSVNLVSSQFYKPKGTLLVNFLSGSTSVNFLTSFFYLQSFSVEPGTHPLGWLGNSGSSEYSESEFPFESKAGAEFLGGVLKDLRELGRLDLKLNYGISEE